MKEIKQFYSPPRKFYVNFYITHYCNLACKICLFSCNPKKSKEILPLEDIIFYTNEFEKDISFSKLAVINGGEATAPYFFGLPNYIATLNSELIKRNFNIEFHTNSVWATSKKADIIWQDLKLLADDIKSDENHVLDLSCDQYHNNLHGLYETFKVLSGPDFNNKKLICNLLSFENDPVFKSVRKEIEKNYPNLNIKYTENNAIVKMGEAKKNNIGIEVQFFNYSNEYRAMYYIWSINNHMSIAFHPDRTASIGTFYDTKQRVSYINKNGKLKPWVQLYPELVEKYIECFINDKCNLFTLKDLKNFLIPYNQR